MAIETWYTPAERKYIETRKAIRKADRAEKKRMRTEQERAELWAFYRDYDPEESFAAQAEARELKRAHEMRQEIAAEVIITEMDGAARC